MNWLKLILIKKLCEFSQWSERCENTRKDKKKVDGREVELNRELTDDDFLYLQENYIVTDGIYKDENIIFDTVTPEWKDFCDRILEFEIPLYASVQKWNLESLDE